MKPASTALVNFLNDPANLSAIQIDLYTFRLTSGEILRYSGGNTALTLPAAAFPTGSINFGAAQTFALGPRFGRSKVSNKIGVEPAELDIDVLAGGNDLVGTWTFANAVRMGIFDGATVELDRFFAPLQTNGAGAIDTSLGCLLWFYGHVADCDIGRSKISIKVKSLMNLLALQQMPRRLYGAGCSHIFGDTMCGYDRVNGLNALGAPTYVGQQTYAAITGSSQSAIVVGSALNAAYIQGTIIGATGANAGFTRTISNIIGAEIYLLKPWLLPVTIGDTFNILPGCDHTVATCNGVFQNLLRFGGMPFVPPPEYAFALLGGVFSSLALLSSGIFC